MADENGQREYYGDNERVPPKMNSDTKVVIEEFIKRLVELEVKKKTLALEIKELKDEYKEQNIAVAVVCSIFKRILRDKKRTDSERFEEESMLVWMGESEKVDEQCLKLS